MILPDSSQDLSSEIEIDAFRRIFPLRFFERHLSESLRPDARPLGKARDTIDLFHQLMDLLLPRLVPLLSRRRMHSSGMMDLKELCLVSGKDGWMGYLDMYCLDADGWCSFQCCSAFSAGSAFPNLQIPVVAMNDNGRISTGILNPSLCSDQIFL